MWYLLGFCTCVTSVCQSCYSKVTSGIRPDISLLEDNMKLNIEASWHAIQSLHVLIKFSVYI